MNLITMTNTEAVVEFNEAREIGSEVTTQAPGRVGHNYAYWIIVEAMPEGRNRYRMLPRPASVRVGDFFITPKWNPETKSFEVR